MMCSGEGNDRQHDDDGEKDGGGTLGTSTPRPSYRKSFGVARMSRDGSGRGMFRSKRGDTDRDTAGDGEMQD